MSSSGPTITNIIVVMLENRSYDNVLGWLYNPGNDAPYKVAPPGQSMLDGLTGNETNPSPDGGNPIAVMNQTTTIDGKTQTSYPGTAVPLYDPGESFADMAQEITGGSSKPSSNPYNKWPPSDSGTAMQGFTLNYAQIRELGWDLPKVPSSNYPDVMNYFTPAQVPVTAWLANNFAVCDQWCASVPTQTFTNRAFTHCAAPAVHQELDGSKFSLIDDVQYVTDSIIELPSVFSKLDEAFPGSVSSSPPNWKVYFHDYSISSIVTPYVYSAGTSSDNVNLATYDYSDWGQNPEPDKMPKPKPLGDRLSTLPTTFVEDLANNTLPMYSFIEPRYSSTYATNQNAPNSNHPGGAGYLDIVVSNDNPPIDVADGECFLLQLYNALQKSDCWDTSLLIITYDEHGGVFDHVLPPTATPPGGGIPAASCLTDKTADGFNFNVFGCRVPAIIVSPFIAAGTTISPPEGFPPFDHTSILKTVWDCFNISDSLTARDAAAPSLYPSLASTKVNTTGQCPVTICKNSDAD